MKNCSKCGLWSADSASCCSHCGEVFVNVPQEEVAEIEVFTNRNDGGGVSTDSLRYGGQEEIDVFPNRNSGSGIYESDPLVGEIENHLLKAIISTACCCIPIGIVAIIYALQVGSKLRANDIDGAINASDKANRWSNIAIYIGILPNILILFFRLFLVPG